MRLRQLAAMPFFLVVMAIGLFLGAVELSAFLAAVGYTGWLDWLTQVTPGWWNVAVTPNQDWGWYWRLCWVAVPTSLTLAFTACITMIVPWGIMTALDSEPA